jgi:hypothetical protein
VFNVRGPMSDRLILGALPPFLRVSRAAKGCEAPHTLKRAS